MLSPQDGFTTIVSSYGDTLSTSIIYHKLLSITIKSLANMENFSFQISLNVIFKNLQLILCIHSRVKILTNLLSYVRSSTV